MSCSRRNNKTFYIEDNNCMTDSFLEKIIEKEVKKLKPKKRKQLKKILKVIQTSSILTLGVNQKVFAQTKETVSLIEGLPSQDSIMELVAWATSNSIVLGVGIGMLYLILTRLLYFHPKKDMSKKALELGTNAVKGITEIILISPIIGIIIIIAFLLLGKSPFFHLPV